MSLLLDTHVVYWLLAEPERLSPQLRAALVASEMSYVSAVSAWEIATKVRIGKWPGAIALLPDVNSKIVAAGLQPLDLTFAQAERSGLLDSQHRDPFDRMLAAQALDLDLAIATVDPVFATLGCKVI